MATNIFADLVSNLDIEAESTEPVFGAAYKDEVSAIKEKVNKLAVRVFTGSMCAPDDRHMIEDILTRGVRSQNLLEKPGDVMILSENSTFDKAGTFFMAVKYCEVLDVPVNE